MRNITDPLKTRRFYDIIEKAKKKTFFPKTAVGVLWDTSYDRIDTEERI